MTERPEDRYVKDPNLERFFYEERDLQSLWEIVDFWTTQLMTAIDRFEASSRRVRLYLVGVSLGAFLAWMTTSLALATNSAQKLIDSLALVSSSLSIAFVGGSLLLALISSSYLIVNELYNVRTQRREIADAYHVFKEVQQMLVATIEVYSNEQRHRTLADVRGRLMMMSYLERKALRYIDKAKLWEMGAA